MGFIISVAIVIVLILIVFIIYCGIASMKCAVCKKLGLKLYKKEEVGRHSITKVVTEKVKNKQGEVIGTTRNTIPVIRVKYLCTYKCKYCGNKEKLTKEEEL